MIDNSKINIRISFILIPNWGYLIPADPWVLLVLLRKVVFLSISNWSSSVLLLEITFPLVEVWICTILFILVIKPSRFGNENASVIIINIWIGSFGFIWTQRILVRAIPWASQRRQKQLFFWEHWDTGLKIRLALLLFLFPLLHSLYYLFFLQLFGDPLFFLWAYFRLYFLGLGWFRLLLFLFVFKIHDQCPTEEIFFIFHF